MSKDLTDALNDLMQPPPANVVPAPKARGAASVAVSAAPVASVSGGGGQGSAAVNMTEPDYSARTWWPAKVVTTTDGLFAIQFAPVKKIRMADPDSVIVDFNFAEPPA